MLFKRLVLTAAAIFCAAQVALALDYVALKNELINDPTGIGYAASIASGNDVQTAFLINEVRIVAPTFTINRGAVPAKDIINQIVNVDFVLLTSIELQRLQLVTAFGTVDLGSANTRTILAAIFPAGSTTRTNLIVLSNRPCSRAEFLFGSGILIDQSDIAKALR